MIEGKYAPVAIAALVGLGDGALAQTTIPTTHKYAHGIYKIAALTLGVLGELSFGWHPNLSYGLMTGASALLGARIPPAIKDSKLSEVATMTAPQSVSAFACSGCGVHALVLPPETLPRRA